MNHDDMQATYREEFIARFEQGQSPLRRAVRQEACIKGPSAVFLVAGVAPPGAFELTEWHDLTRRTEFNLYTSQGDSRRILQDSTIAVANHVIDLDIVAALGGGTHDNGAAVTASLSLVVFGLAILGSSGVPLDENIFAAITPAFHAYLIQTKEFASADYQGGDATAFRWAGVNFIVHPNLPGKGTAAEKCFMWHKDAIGHACDMSAAEVAVGMTDQGGSPYVGDGLPAYSWARTSWFMGAKLLQPNGVFVMNHDGSEYAAEYVTPPRGAKGRITLLSDWIKDTWKAVFGRVKKDTQE